MSGTILASAIIDKVAGALMNDPNKVRFKQAHLLAFLNEICKFIAGINPSSSSDIQTVTLVAGSRQTVPATANALLDVPYNVNADDSLGRSITPVRAETIDWVLPNWRSGAQKSEVRNVIADDKTPTIFHVYPPVLAGVKVACTLAVTPVDVSAGQPIPLEDTYEVAIIHGMLSRCYQKKSEYAGDPERAAAYWSSMLQAIGIKAQVDPAASAEGETKGP